MNSDDSVTGPVNIGNPGEFNMLELAEKVLALMCSKSKFTFKPLPQDDPRQRKPDIALAKQKLDRQPAIPLNVGLHHAIEYFRKYA